MKRWLLPIALSLLVIVSFFVVRHILAKQAQRKREAHYQSVLSLCTADLRPGMTRGEVEGYLHARNVNFRQMCCVDLKDFRKGVWDDLTKIGAEDAPWFCSENNVYVAFQFTGKRQMERPQWNADASDTLKAVTLYHWLEGCL